MNSLSIASLLALSCMISSCVPADEAAKNESAAYTRGTADGRLGGIAEGRLEAQNEAKQQGYAEGWSAAYNVGYNTGFDVGQGRGQREGWQKGFTDAHPGRPLAERSDFRKILKPANYFGAGQILFTIFLFCVTLIRRSVSPTVAAAKTLALIVGAASALFCGLTFGVGDAAPNLLLSPAPPPAVMFLVVLAFAALSYAFIALGRRLLDYLDGDLVEAGAVFVAAAIGALISATVYRVLDVAPDGVAYMMSCILIGSLFGAAIYLIKAMIDFDRKRRTRARYGHRPEVGTVSS